MFSSKRTILPLKGLPKQRILKAEKYEKGYFFKVSKHPLHTPALSWRAKGLWFFLQSYPSNFQHTFINILKHSKEKEEAIKTSLKELAIHKLLIRQQVSRKGSAKIECIGIVSETPIESNTFFISQSPLNEPIPQGEGGISLFFCTFGLNVGRADLVSPTRIIKL